MNAITESTALRQRQEAAGRVVVRWRPPLAEVLFSAVLLWLLVGGRAGALLADGDTGWHIRTGDYILAKRKIPSEDLFSFSRPGAAWFAWEWGSDVILALADRAAGLKGVTLLGGVLIAATLAMLLQWMLWHGVHVLAAVLLVLLAGSASTIHWLARPHLFTSLFFVASLWLLEADHRRPCRHVWLLVPLAALWANLHGGFAVLPATLGLCLAGSIISTLSSGRPWRWSSPRRYGALLAAVSAATLLNPYGYRLHAHIWGYLGSSFIRDGVEEFQSPRFRGESMAAFEALLVGGLLAVAWLWKRREFATALLLLVLAHWSLTSVRHVPLYAVAAAPALGRLATAAMRKWRGPWGEAVASLADDLAAAASRRSGRWAPVVGLSAVAAAAVVLDSGPARWRVEFPREKFPHAALAAVEEKLVGRRVLTSDQWGDYLIYRYYPRMRVFIDGRSDFYGPEIGRQYLEAMQANHRWEEILRRYDLEVALLPSDWPLATVLKAHREWRLDYDDGQALVLRRVGRSSVPSAN